MNRVLELVSKCLQETGQTTAPVRIRPIAKSLGLEVRASPFNDDLSGLLVIRDGSAKIGVNSRHSRNRRRFTVAHEIGHYLLHFKGEDQVFIDKMDLTFRRDKKSSSGSNSDEMEANAFAAEILMPRHFIKNFVRELGEPIDERKIRKMAKAFVVSEQAMTFRLINLGFIKPAI